MKAIFWLLILGLFSPIVRAQTNLTELLQQGMFEEQANRNLGAAIADYEALSTQFDKDRQLAATAVFRLGECYREEGQTNQAAMEYRRIISEFSDQKTLVMLSQQDLAGMGAAPSVAGEIIGNPAAPVASGNTSAEVVLLANEISGIESLTDTVEQARAVLAISPENSGDLQRVLMHLPMLQDQEAWAEAHPQTSFDEYDRTRGFIFAIGGGEELPGSMLLSELQQHVKNTNLLPCAQWELQKELTYIQQHVDFVLGLQKARLKALQAAAGTQTASETAQGQAPTDDEDKEIAHLQEMLKNSPDLINATGSGGWPPLVAAANSDHLRVAQFLLEHNADVNVQSHGGTPLVAAAASGHKAMVELLLNHGADIQAKDPSFGQTALHFAASRGFEAVTETLLAAHADFNAQDNNGDTPLFLAVENGHTRIVHMLLAAGANANAKDSYGDTALWPAVAGLPDIAKMLLSAGADANTTNNDGRTPLGSASESGVPETVKLLLAAKADPNGGTCDPPLLSAIDKQDTTSAELLLQAGANANLKGLIDGSLRNLNRDGYNNTTPLWAAVSGKQLPMVQLLLKYKADPNSSRINNTPIIFSALDKPYILQALLNADANPNVTNDIGRTPLSFAAEEDSPEAIRFLLAARADPNGGTLDAPLLRAIDKHDLASAELLLQAGANPNTEGTMHCPQGLWGSRWYYEFSAIGRSATPLWLATGTHQFQMVQLLLKYKANPNDSQIGDTPVIFWALSNTNILQALLDAGANPNVRGGGDYGRETPLISSINSGNNPATTILLKHGADPNFGVSELKPLHVAANQLDEEGARLLLDYGADPNVRNGDGQTPMRIVEDVESGKFRAIHIPSDQQKTIAASMADLLRQHGALEVLPDWDHITVSRPSTKYSETIFDKGTNGWNQFTLYDLLGVQYNLLTTDPRTIHQDSVGYDRYSPVNNDLQFPDFSRILIRRPPVRGTNWTDLKIDLARALDSGDRSADVPLKFGDVVDIPETDHVLNAPWTGLTTNQLLTLAHCLTRHLQISVNGMTTNITVAPRVELQEFYGGFGRSKGLHAIINLTQEGFMLWPVLDDSQLLLSSSDLSHVTVKRRDAATGQVHEWTVDCSNPDTAPYFWLRDGDEVDVPEASGQ